MKKLVKVETGKKAQQSDAMKLGWLTDIIGGAIKWDDTLSPQTRQFIFTELMAVLDPIKDREYIDGLVKGMSEQGFEVKEEVTELNLLHEQVWIWTQVMLYLIIIKKYKLLNSETQNPFLILRKYKQVDILPSDIKSLKKAGLFVKVMFESNEIATYFLDMECANCGSVATAPTPVDKGFIN